MTSPCVPSKIPRLLGAAFAALCISIPVFAEDGQAAASQATADCSVCPVHYRKESLNPTPDVIAIFKAADTLDEAVFGALLAKTPGIDRYLVDDHTLLSRLLWPASVAAAPDTGQREVYWEMTDEKRTRLRAEHRATLPARTRMLALALQNGVNPNDLTYHSRLAGLHMAMLFGTPEMVDILLRAGANPNLKAGTFAEAPPIAHTLDSEYEVRLTRLPDLVSRQERTDMIMALLKAGAKLPYAERDEGLQKDRASQAGPAKEKNGKVLVSTAVAADALLWEPLVEMTEGQAVLDAFVSLGTRPPPVTADQNLLARAAYAGNPPAVAWLQKQLPRYYGGDTNNGGAGKRDAWSEAAIWALETPFKEKRLPIFQLLVNAKTDWASLEGRGFREHYLVGLNSNNRSSSFGHSLLPRTVAAGDVALLDLALSLNAVRRTEVGPDASKAMRKVADGADSPTGDALVQAMLMQRGDLLQRLLVAGASPLALTSSGTTPLAVAVNPQAASRYGDAKPLSKEGREFFTSSLDVFLKGLTPAQIRASDTPERTPLRDAIGSSRRATDSVLVDKLVAAGFSPANLPIRYLVTALESHNTGLALAMLDAGLGKIRTPSKPGGATDDEKDMAMAMALAALAANGPVLDRLQALRTPGISLTPAEFETMSRLADAGRLDAMKLLQSRGWVIDRTMNQPALNTMRPAVIDFVLKTTRSSMEGLCIEQSPHGLRPNQGFESPALVNAMYWLDDAEWQQLLASGITQLKSCPLDKDNDPSGRSTDTAGGAEPIEAALLPRPMTLAAVAVLSDPFAVVGTRKASLPARIAQLVAQGMKPPDFSDAALKEALEPSTAEPGLSAVLAALGAPASVTPEKTAAKPETAADAARLHPRSLVGTWQPPHGGELAQMLELKADGRFDWSVSYGAVDRYAQGNWSADGGKVVFTSDPIAPFNWFKLTGQSQYSDGPELGQPFTVSVDVGEIRFLDDIRAELQAAPGEFINLRIQPGTANTVKVRGQPRTLALWFSDMESMLANEVALPALPRLKSVTLTLQLPVQAPSPRVHEVMALDAEGLRSGATLFQKLK